MASLKYTVESFNEKLAQQPRTNGGILRMLAPFMGSSEVHQFVCEVGHKFDRRAAELLSRKRDGCPECFKANPENFRHNVRGQDSVEAELREKCPNIRIANGYSATYKPADLECTDCGHSWSSTIYQILRANRANGCPKCAMKGGNAKKSMGRCAILDKLREVHGSRITLLSKEVLRATDVLQFKCGVCMLDFRSTASALFRGRGCPNCSLSTSFRHKPHILGYRTVYVQGYEPFVLRELTEVMGVCADDIHVWAEGKVPRIRYEFNGKEHDYRPDIIAKGVIYEVKSYYTLGLGGASGVEIWLRNVAKAKAVEDVGYKYRMAVSSKTGSVVVLPEDWSNRNAKELLEIMSEGGIKVPSGVWKWVSND